MGNASSSDPADNDDWDQFEGIDTLGYRVLGVQPDSPASEAGLVSFFDFLVGANETMLLGTGEGLEEGEEYDDVDFPGMLQEHLNKPLELLVWNIKHQEKRLVTIVPNNDWGGAGLLGVTIRLDNYGGADERLIRVLSVEHQSPASIAGLVPLQDYLLGTTTESFGDSSVLASVLYEHVDQVVELYVYNTDSDVVRVVSLLPTWSWGGNGLLGAEVGTGYLHRLPQASRGTTGSSVERKVRVVAQHHQRAEPAAAHMAPTPRGQQPTPERQQVMLEVEPQLEMEVEDEDEARPEDTNKTIYQVADHRGNETRKEAVVESFGVQKEEINETRPAPDAVSADDTKLLEKEAVEVADPAAQTELPTPLAAQSSDSNAQSETMTSTPTVESRFMMTAPTPFRSTSTYSPSPVANAAALFAAGPPPGVDTNAPPSSSLLPPPPLSFLSSQQ